EVAGVQEAVADGEDLAEAAGVEGGDGGLAAGQERELGGDADNAAESGGSVADAAGGGEVDAEGFLGEQVFARAEHVEVERLVEVMRHGDVNDVDVGAGQQRVVVGLEMAHGRNLAEPVEGGGVDVADADEFGADRAIEQREPAAKGAGDLAAHEAGADDGDADGSGGGHGGGRGRTSNVQHSTSNFQ